MTTLKDLIEREIKEFDDGEWSSIAPDDWNKDNVIGYNFAKDDFRDFFRQSLETIAKETANALRGEEIEDGVAFQDGELPPAEVMSEMYRDIENVKKGHHSALQDIAKREEEFFK